MLLFMVNIHTKFKYILFSKVVYFIQTKAWIWEQVYGRILGIYICGIDRSWYIIGKGLPKRIGSLKNQTLEDF